MIRSIPPMAKWLPVIPLLYTMTSTADIFSTLLAHGMILDRGTWTKPTLGSSNVALAARSVDSCANPNCKAKKCLTHSTANCYWPGRGKEGQFPPNFGQKTRANAVATAQGGTEHFILSTKVFGSLGNSGVVIDDDENGEDTAMALISKSFQSFSGGRILTFIDSGA